MRARGQGATAPTTGTPDTCGGQNKRPDACGNAPGPDNHARRRYDASAIRTSAATATQTILADLMARAAELPNASEPVRTHVGAYYDATADGDVTVRELLAAINDAPGGARWVTGFRLHFTADGLAFALSREDVGAEARPEVLAISAAFDESDFVSVDGVGDPHE